AEQNDNRTFVEEFVHEEFESIRQITQIHTESDLKHRGQDHSACSTSEVGGGLSWLLMRPNWIQVSTSRFSRRRNFAMAVRRPSCATKCMLRVSAGSKPRSHLYSPPAPGS